MKKKSRDFAAPAGRSTTARSVTLRDVASAAGVTPMTVSNVMTGRPGSVGAATAARILSVVERLGYQPNAIGRRLRDKRTNTIAMVVLDDAPGFLADPFNTNLIAGLGNFATDNGRSLLLQGVHSSSQAGVPMLSHLETDGICVIASGSRDERKTLFERLGRLRQPIVVFQDRMAGDDVCTIRQNDRDGARKITRYLLDQGMRTFFLLLPAAEWPAMVERERGVRETAKKAGASIVIVRCGDEGIADTTAAVSAAMREAGRPDAIIGGNDRMAIAALQVLAEMNIQVPEQIRVTGYNAFEFAQYANPSLTTVRSPAYEMGRLGGELMLDRLAEGRFRKSEVIIPVELVIGKSA